jgi:ABC-type molybdenum transport system ATPase subunit/photorepair protein PhrA
MPFSLDQVSLDLGPRPLLRDLSLHIAPGERVVAGGQRLWQDHAAQAA